MTMKHSFAASLLLATLFAAPALAQQGNVNPANGQPIPAPAVKKAKPAEVNPANGQPLQAQKAHKKPTKAKPNKKKAKKTAKKHK